MPVPNEYASFFSGLVDKSRKSEVNWQVTGQANSYRVAFPDFAIEASQENDKLVRVRLLNEGGLPIADFTIDDNDDNWLGAVGLVNSAKRSVMKVDQTMRRAMEELAKDGPIGESSD